MSARRSTFLPRACSGLMYAAVPRMTLAAVIGLVTVGERVNATSPETEASPSSALASPKSSTLTRPSPVSFTFAGFKSR